MSSATSAEEQKVAQQQQNPAPDPFQARRESRAKAKAERMAKKQQQVAAQEQAIQQSIQKAQAQTQNKRRKISHTDVIGKRIIFREYWGNWISGSISRYDVEKQEYVMNQQEYLDPMPQQHQFTPEEERWVNLDEYIYRVEGSDILHRKGQPCPFVPIDWWKQPPQPTLTSTSTSTSTQTWNHHVHPLLNLLLHGTISSTSPFRHLRGQSSTLLRLIWQWYVNMSCHWIHDSMSFLPLHDPARVEKRRDDWTFFPKPQGLHICNMPIISHDITSLPDELLNWDKMLYRAVNERNVDQTVYVTIHEYPVKAGDIITHQHHYAPHGIHIASRHLIASHHAGSYDDSLPPRCCATTGGIYMASSLSTCRIWKSHLQLDEYRDIAKYDGSLEHLDTSLSGQSHLIPANQMYWRTATTPIEFIPTHVEQDGWYQYIQIITSPLQVWDASRYTSNPLGIQPAAPIINGNSDSDTSMSTSMSTSPLLSSSPV